MAEPATLCERPRFGNVGVVLLRIFEVRISTQRTSCFGASPGQGELVCVLAFSRQSLTRSGSQSLNWGAI